MKNTNNIIMDMEYGILAANLNNRTKFYMLLESFLKLEEAYEKLKEQQKNEQ